VRTSSEPSARGLVLNEPPKNPKKQRDALPVGRVVETNLGSGVRGISSNVGEDLSLCFAVLEDPFGAHQTVKLSPYIVDIQDKSSPPRLRYTSGDKPARGAHGSVRKAIDLTTSQTVAIKTVRYKNIRTARREIELLGEPLAGVQNVVQLLSAWDSPLDNVIHLILELGQRDLFDVVHKNPLPEPMVEEYMAQVLSGVTACHQAGVAHQDLKLENLVLMPDGSVKLIDFGLSSRFKDEYSTSLSRLQVPPIGTLRYLAPEVVVAIFASPALQVDEQYLSTLWSKDSLIARDLWACGVILIDMKLAKPLWMRAGPDDPHYMYAYGGDPAKLKAKLKASSDHLTCLACTLLDPEPQQRARWNL